MAALNTVESEAINGEITVSEEVARNNAFTVITILSFNSDFPEPRINGLMQKLLGYAHEDFGVFLQVGKDTNVPEYRYFAADDLMERGKDFLLVPAQFAELSSWGNEEARRQLASLVEAASLLVSPMEEDWVESRVAVFNKKAERIDWVELFDKYEAQGDILT